MQFIQLQIVGFGKLSGTFDFSESGLVLVVDRNEAGKTTIANALLYALYGFPDGRTNRDELNRISQFLPWNGKPFQTTLQVALTDRQLTITREFLPKKLVRVIDSKTKEDLTKQYYPGKTDSVGELITGLSYPEALQTMFLRQAASAVGIDRTNLVNSIQRLATSATSNNTVTAAITLLEKSLSEYQYPILSRKGASITYEINQLEKKIQEILDQETAIEQERNRLLDAIDREREIETRLQELDQLHAVIEYQRLQSESSKLEQELLSSEKLITDYEALSRQIGVLEPFRNISLLLEDRVAEKWAIFQQKQKDLREQFDLQLHKLQSDQRTLSEKIATNYPNQITPSQRDLLIELRSGFTRFESDTNNLAVAQQSLQKRLTANGINPDNIIQANQRWQTVTPSEEELVLSSIATITQYTEKKNLSRSEIRKFENDIKDLEDQLAEASKSQKWWSITAILIVLVGVAGFIVSLPVWLSSILILVGVGLLLAGIFRKKSRQNTFEVQYAVKREALSHMQQQFDSLELEYSSFNQNLEQIRKKVGIQGNKDLFVAVQQRRSNAADIHEWLAIQDKLHTLTTSVGNIKTDIVRIAAEIGRPLDIESITTSAIQERIQFCDLVIKERLALDSISNERIIKEQEREQKSQELASIEKELRNLLLSSEVPQDLPLEDGVAWFRNACNQKRELTRAEADRSKLAVQVPTQPVLVELRSALEKANSQLLTTPLPKPVNQSEQQVQNTTLQAIDQEKKVLYDERTKLQFALRDFQNRWSELGGLRRNRIEYISALAQTKHFQQAARYAIDQLTTLSSQTHQKWSEQLTTRSQTFLDQLHGSVQSIQFQENLSLSVTLRDGRVLSEKASDHDISVLSTGVRDQLYLAMRLAVTDFLSRNNVLPIILDEPFAHADDERFQTGMRMLSELAVDRQVIVLTCHEHRHQLWKQNNSHPVQWINASGRMSA